ncbi:MAG: ATP-binding protein [Bacillota bacterium]
MAKRKIININEDLCDGCGLCVSPCAESAIEIVNGKARVISDELCDGMGVCLSACPTGALTLEEREAAEFSPEAVEQRQREIAHNPADAFCHRCGSDDQDRALLQIRKQGKQQWVCTRCLPVLIHG